MAKKGHVPLSICTSVAPGGAVGGATEVGGDAADSPTPTYEMGVNHSSMHVNSQSDDGILLVCQLISRWCVVFRISLKM